MDSGTFKTTMQTFNNNNNVYTDLLAKYKSNKSLLKYYYLLSNSTYMSDYVNNLSQIANSVYI